jgi:hypothetical protein
MSIKHITRHASALALTVCLVGTAAHGGQITDLAQEAEALIDKGDGLAGYEKVRAALAEATAKIPFDIRKAFFVSEKPIVFGNYSRVGSNDFPVGSSLITYAEPVGLLWRTTDRGGVQAQFTVDFELRNPAGEVLAEQKAFGSFKIESKEPVFEIYTPLTLDVSSVPAGDYVLKYTFNDVNSKKSSDIEQRFALK